MPKNIGPTSFATAPDPGYAVLFYDGVCGLCNRSVRWVLRRDSRAAFRFAHLASAAAKDLPAPLVPEGVPSTLVLQASGRYFTKSDAWLKIFSLLGAPWSGLTFLRIIPRPVRDFVYDAIAARRYRWFGRLDRCPLPDPGTRDRFLD